MQSNILRENARMKYDDQLSLNIQNTPKASLDFGFIGELSMLSGQ